MTAGTTPLEITALTKTYGHHTAVDDLDLDVAGGEVFGILGLNGAGKTTTVECAQGLRRPDSGTIRVLGHDPIHERNRIRGRVGSQLQDSNLPERLRVSEATRLFADSPAQADRIMSDWDLHDLGGQAFGELSGGQQQRLFLALALLNDPEIVFLDELTQGLDPNARREVWGLIERVNAGGTTVVLVTHHMDEAEELCDRVAVMRDGAIVDSGTPRELTARHSSGTRIRFLGDAGQLDRLRSLPDVVGATFEDGMVEVSGPSRIVAHVGAALVADGRVPDRIEVRQPTLEEAMLDLIGTEPVEDS